MSVIMKSSPPLAVTILLLLLFGGMMVNTATGVGKEENEVLQAEQVERTVGLAGHKLDDRKKKVTLFDGSKPATTKEDYEGYKKKYPDGACDVELGEDQEKGYIVISYSKTSKAAESGCTVDLYTDLEDKIEFSAFLRNVEGGGPAGCLKPFDDTKFDGYNDNVLPFAYSHPAILDELKERGPELETSASGCKGDVCLDKVCIKKTSLELRWVKHADKIDLLINPIGSPSYKQASEEMTKFEKQKQPTAFPKVKIEKADKYSVRFGNNEALEQYKEYNCTHNPAGNILTPLTWEMNGTNLDPKKKHLLAFHLLPQKASRMIQWVLPPNAKKINPKGPNPKGVSDEQPKGPECEELQILFSRTNYDLLTVVPPTTTTTTTTPAPTTSTQPTTTTVTTTTEEPKSAATTIIIVIVVVLLLCSSCAGAIVYFVFLKKKGGGDGADDEDKSKMDDNKSTKSKRDDDGTKSKNDKGTNKGTKSKGGGDNNTKSLTSMNDKTTNSAAAGGGGVTSSRVKDAEEGDNKKGTSTALDNTASLEL